MKEQLEKIFCAFGVGLYQMLAYKTDCACCVGWRLATLLAVFVLLPAAISGLVLGVALIIAFWKGSSNATE